MSQCLINFFSKNLEFLLFITRGSFTTYGIGHRMAQVLIFPTQRVNREFTSDQIAQELEQIYLI